MKTLLIILICALMPVYIIGQDSTSDNMMFSEKSIQELIETKKIVINYQLVKSVQNYTPPGEYISFSEIYYDLRGEERNAFLRNYLVMDFENETLDDIRQKSIDQVNNNEFQSYETQSIAKRE